jgi:selenocysteine lyase/cysteine desulfurase
MRGGGGDSLYSDSVAIIKKYFNTENIIFTGGATDSLNVLANAWKGGIRVYNNTHTSAVAQCRQ